MQIVSINQVKLCQVIDSNSQKVPALLYQGKLFQQIAAYPKERSQDAMKKGKEEFLARKGQVLILIVEGEKGLTIWFQNDQLKLPVKKEKPRDILTEIKLEKLIEEMRSHEGIETKNRFYNIKKYPRCFVGSEAIEWMINKYKISVEDAIKLGQKLIDDQWIHHVTDDHQFENGNLFYRFYTDESEIPEIAQIAFNRFNEGLVHKNWDLFLEILTDDFSFYFPTGEFKGENIGKEKAAEFFKYISETVFPEGLFLTVKRITSSEHTVVFEVESQGKMFDQPCHNQAAISFDIRNDKICAYREYLSMVFPNS
jgi:ketosteroid isomerase-like protein